MSDRPPQRGGLDDQAAPELTAASGERVFVGKDLLSLWIEHTERDIQHFHIRQVAREDRMQGQRCVG